MDEKLLTVLTEMNNRLNDIAIMLQVIGLMNISIDHRENGYNYLCDIMSKQKEKYLS